MGKRDCLPANAIQYFNDILYETVWKRKDAKFRNAALKLEELLEERRITRIKNIGEEIPDFIPIGGKDIKKTAREVSKILIRITRNYFKADGGAIDWDCFQKSFMWFANGELDWFPHPKAKPTKERRYDMGRPDGRWFFLYGEMALLCMELDIDKPLWKKMAETMIKSQEIFTSAFPPRGDVDINDPVKTSNRFRDYHHDGKVSEAEKKKLHKRYEKWAENDELEERHEENLKKLTEQKGVEKFKPGKPPIKPPNDKDEQKQGNGQKDDENENEGREQNQGGDENQPKKGGKRPQSEAGSHMYNQLKGVLASMRWAVGQVDQDPEKPCKKLVERMHNLLDNMEMITDLEQGIIPYGPSSQRPQHTWTEEPQPHPYYRISLELQSVHIQSHDIGNDWNFTIQLPDTFPIALTETIDSGEEIVPLLSLKVWNHQARVNEQAIHLPVQVHVVETDPKFNDEGIISGVLEIPLEDFAGHQTISGVVNAQRADTGEARIDFTFGWTCYPIL
ncbi:MAG: hypothetical protein AAFP76_06305 [Bacteroidota bacterium]